MARPPRRAGAGTAHHLIVRGNNGGTIFLTGGGRETFLGMLDEVGRRYGWRCFAYCLMGNHAHLAVETPADGLSDGMRDLCGRYARWFNSVQSRRGHLFGARFHSVLIEDDRQLHAVIRYIALNPVRAGLVRKPVDWPWSSHRHVLGRPDAPACLDIPRALSLVAGDGAAAMAKIRELVEGEPVLGDRARRIPGTTERLMTAWPPGPTPRTLVHALGPVAGVAACVALGYRQAEIAAFLNLSRAEVGRRWRTASSRKRHASAQSGW